MRQILGPLFLLITLDGLAFASCGAAACSIQNLSSFVHEKGQFHLAYAMEYIDQNQPRAGTHRASAGEISGHHDEQRTINRLHRLTGTWGVMNRLNLEASLPYISRSHRHIHNHHGTPIPQGWDFACLGDLSVQSRWAFYRPDEIQRPAISLITGVEFPTGKSEVTNADGNDAEPGVTPGSDSFDFVVGVGSLQQLSVPTLNRMHARAPLFMNATYKMNGPGHQDYRIGNALAVDIGLIYPLNSVIGFGMQANFLAKELDEPGETHEEVEKTGGEYLYFSPGLLFQLNAHWQWFTWVQLPVYQRVNEIQLTSDYNLQTGLLYRFRI